MTVNVQKTAEQEFSQNKKDIISDIVCGTLATALPLAATVYTGSYIAGVATLAFGLVTVGEVYEYFKCTKTSKKNIEYHP